MPASLGMRIRERPSLHLGVSVKTPAGVTQRWGFDNPNPIYAPKNLSFGDTMPGGFERFSCTLQRNPRLSYADLEPLSKVTVTGPGGAVAWQGRLEKFPDTAGYQSQVTPEGVGYQAAMEDDTSARENYVDQERSRWGAAPVQRKINILEAPADYEDPSIGTGALNPQEAPVSPSVITALSGPWARFRVCEAWYDAQGLGIGGLYYSWHPGAGVGSGFEVAAALVESPTIGGIDHQVYSLAAFPTGASAFLTATSFTRRFAIAVLQLPAGGGAAQVYPVFFSIVATYGLHGLPRYGPTSTTEAQGLLASDVVSHALRTWAPGLAFTTGVEGTLRPTSFIIPQLAFFEPTNAAEILKQATRFELPDWAVWEGPRFYMAPRGGSGRRWQARVGPAQLQAAGPQVSRLWNGVVVQYQDVTGVQQTVGPPGFAGASAASEDAGLLDTDPENPLNQTGTRKWALLKMSTSTVEGAKAVGRKFLEEQKLLETSGQASLVGHVEDENGTYWPAWSVRSGDTVAFLDAANPAPRRVVSKSYDDPLKTNALQLEQPPDSMQALLERLSVVLVGTLA